MNTPLLVIQPQTLMFVVELKKQSSCVLQLTNTTHHYVAFMVKTTSPKKYCVRPNAGIVAPKSSCEVTIRMQAFKEPPPNMVCEDKFLIQSLVVPAETAYEDVTSSMFSKVEGKHIGENKLRVTLVSPSDSPELSPINGTPEQDRLCSQSLDMVTYPDEPKIPKERDVVQLQKTDKTDGQNLKGLNEFKLVKDIEEMKLKVNALESKLKQAESSISKLMQEQSVSSQNRESLQQAADDAKELKPMDKLKKYLKQSFLFNNYNRSMYERLLD